MIEIGLNNTNPTVTNIIKSMMSKNLIYKIQDKVDKRKYYLYLTPLGLSIASECAKRMEATDIAAYKNLTEEELKTLRVLLEKCRILREKTSYLYGNWPIYMYCG